MASPSVGWLRWARPWHLISLFPLRWRVKVGTARDRRAGADVTIPRQMVPALSPVTATISFAAPSKGQRAAERRGPPTTTAASGSTVRPGWLITPASLARRRHPG